MWNASSISSALAPRRTNRRTSGCAIEVQRSSLSRPTHSLVYSAHFFHRYISRTDPSFSLLTSLLQPITPDTGSDGKAATNVVISDVTVISLLTLAYGGSCCRTFWQCHEPYGGSYIISNGTETRIADRCTVTNGRFDDLKLAPFHLQFQCLCNNLQARYTIK